MRNDIKEGPSQKNQALLDVEYVLFCCFVLNRVTFSRNSQQHLIAHCPGSRKINVTCAFRNANFEYFSLSDDAETQQKEIDAIRCYTKDPEESNTEESDTEECINFQNMNALLRGTKESTTLSDADTTALFLSTLFAISGLNKNTCRESYEYQVDNYRKITKDVTPLALYRREAKPPEDIMARMFTGDIVRYFGMMSFSADDDLSVFKTRIKTSLSRSRQKTIAHWSHQSHEEEHLFSSNCHLIYKNPKIVEGVLEVEAELVHGLATEHTENYLVEVALSSAYEILKKPYKEELGEVEYGVYRPNHALAHHVRVVSYVDNIIEYFKTSSSNPKFREFCESLTHEEIQWIKVMMAFSKTGRKSECSTQDNLTRVNKDKIASAENMRRWIVENNLCVPQKISDYFEILSNMGDPNYTADACKYYIADIASMAHKLDLARCYGSEEYEKALHQYAPNTSHVDASEIAHQKFESLKTQAKNALIATGDCYFDVRKAAKLFRRANHDLFYCVSACKMAEIKEDIQAQEVLDFCLEKNTNTQKMQNLSDAKKMIAEKLKGKLEIIKLLNEIIDDFYASVLTPQTLALSFLDIINITDDNAIMKTIEGFNIVLNILIKNNCLDDTALPILTKKNWKKLESLYECNMLVGLEKTIKLLKKMGQANVNILELILDAPYITKYVTALSTIATDISICDETLFKPLKNGDYIHLIYSFGSKFSNTLQHIKSNSTLSWDECFQRLAQKSQSNQFHKYADAIHYFSSINKLDPGVLELLQSSENLLTIHKSLKMHNYSLICPHTYILEKFSEVGMTNMEAVEQLILILREQEQRQEEHIVLAGFKTITSTIAENPFLSSEEKILWLWTLFNEIQKQPASYCSSTDSKKIQNLIKFEIEKILKQTEPDQISKETFVKANYIISVFDPRFTPASYPGLQKHRNRYRFVEDVTLNDCVENHHSNSPFHLKKL